MKASGLNGGKPEKGDCCRLLSRNKASVRTRAEPGVKLGLNLVFNLFNLDFNLARNLASDEELSFCCGTVVAILRLLLLHILKIIIVMRIISFVVSGFRGERRARLQKKSGGSRGAQSPPRRGLGGSGAPPFANGSNTCRNTNI